MPPRVDYHCAARLGDGSNCAKLGSSYDFASLLVFKRYDAEGVEVRLARRSAKIREVQGDERGFERENHHKVFAPPTALGATDVGRA